MKFFVECVIVVAAAVFATASAEADAGYFIPKAFYTLDAEGHKTQSHPVSPHTAKYLHRLRRQVFSSSSSSSSSASSSNGGPVYFSTHNTVSHTPAGTTSFSQRFGDDGSSYDSALSSSGVGGGAHSSSGVGVGLSAGTSAGYDNSYGSNYAGVHFPTGSNSYGANNAGFGATTGGGNYNTGYNSIPVASRFGSSASSSSSVSSNGGPVYFKTEQSVSHTPAANVNKFSSRFGDEDTPQTVSKTVSTSGYIDEKGVH
ncbi:PREDICTED: uncharacterized serine-rich protein C215.13, partial [Rhagoletis zephyria]|uniref:uncharacterized serine-rich protein C215.13 n=1 Tax=Rhagoletis zephyria TaxID=28612 RepID=UPI0008119913